MRQVLCVLYFAVFANVVMAGENPNRIVFSEMVQANEELKELIGVDEFRTEVWVGPSTLGYLTATDKHGKFLSVWVSNYKQATYWDAILNIRMGTQSVRYGVLGGKAFFKVCIKTLVFYLDSYIRLDAIFP